MSKTPPGMCAVCVRRPATGNVLCDPCRRSLAKVEAKDMTIGATVIWAAERARRFYEGPSR